jgi:hypothetical protein
VLERVGTRPTTTTDVRASCLTPGRRLFRRQIRALHARQRPAVSGFPAGLRRREPSRCDASIPRRDRSVDMPVFAVSSRNAASRSTTPRSAPMSGAHRERFPFPSHAQKSTVPSCSFVGHTRAAARAGSPAEEELCQSVMRLEGMAEKVRPLRPKPMGDVPAYVQRGPYDWNFTALHVASLAFRVASIGFDRIVRRCL